MTVTPWTVPELMRTRRGLRALALRLVADADAADDIVQDAYVAYAMRPEPPERPGSWLSRVTRNLALRWRRERTRRARREAAVALPEPTPDARALAVQVELQRDLADAVLGLAEPYRATLLQRFWEGKSPSAIAAATATPVPTVKARLQRGLAQVRAALDRRYGDRAAWRSALLPMLRAGGTLAVVAVAAPVWWGVAAGMVAVGLSVAWMVAGKDEREATAMSTGIVVASGPDARSTDVGSSQPQDATAVSLRVPVDEPQEARDHLLVEVVRADGSPAADIGIGVRGLYYERHIGRWHENCRSLGRTDARGLLQCDERRQTESGAADDWWQRLGEPLVHVFLDEPGLVDVTSAPMTRAELGRARLRLEMPATGRLRLVSTDAVGRPIVYGDLGHGDRYVQVNQVASDRDASRERPTRSASWSKKCDRSGSTTFAPVGLHVPMTISSSWTPTVKVAPLTRPGEEHVVQVGVGEGAILAGRLLDAAGRPLPHASVGASLRTGMRHEGGSGQTHADGSFAIALGSEESLRREVTDLVIGSDAGVAYPTLSGPLEARVYDLGDVTLRPAPHIVSGRVLWPPSVPDQAPYIDVERLQHVKYLDGSEADVWHRVERAGLRRDGDAFSFHGEIESGRLRVAASSSGARLLPPAPVEFQLGATDVLLSFRAGGTLAVSIAGDAAEGLGLSLEPAPGVVPAHDHSRASIERRSLGEYAASGLWPGRYRLLGQLLGDTQPALVVDGIDVAEGRTTTVGPLSLPVPVRRLTVRIADETEARLRLGAIVVHPALGEKANIVFAPEGEAVIPTTAPSVDVVAVAEGRRAVHAQLEADTTIRLGPAGRRTLILADAMPALPPDVELAFEVHVESTCAGIREPSDYLRAPCDGVVGRRKVSLDAEGRGSVTIAQAGRYLIVPVLLTLKTKFGYQIEIEGAAADLEVGEDDVATTGTLAVTLPEAGMRAALARVGELLHR